MPEGHVLHRLAAALTESFAGPPVVSSSPQGRFSAGAALFDGTTIASADAVGKHLFINFAEVPQTAHVHLGLYGKWSFVTASPLPVTGAVRWRLDSGTTTADLRGPAACAALDPPAVEAIRARLGPDPIRDDADPDAAWQRIAQSRRPIADLLMDQSVVAGAGNIFRAEVLFRQGIDPYVPGNQLGRERWDAVWADLVVLMRSALKLGRIDTVRPEHEPEAMGRPPREDDHGGEVYVYRRALKECHRCGADIAVATLANRNLFWCPGCQQRR